APAISSSLAILVSAEMLISFIADREITWAGAGVAWGWPWAGAWVAVAAPPPPPFGLGDLLSASTVRPILRRPALTPAGRAVETTIRGHRHDACAPPASAS